MSDKKRGMRFIETVGVGPVTEEYGRGPQFMESAIINERQRPQKDQKETPAVKEAQTSDDDK